MMILTAIRDGHLLDEAVRDLYVDGRIDLDTAIHLSLAASLHKIAENGLEVSYNQYADTSFPIHVMAYSEDGSPTEPVRVKIVGDDTP